MMSSTKDTTNLLDDDINILTEENTARDGVRQRNTPANRPILHRDLNPPPKSLYESLDYEVCENQLWKVDQEKLKDPRFVVWKNFTRWVTFLLIGICTALVACVIDIVIEEIAGYKYGFLKEYMVVRLYPRGYVYNDRLTFMNDKPTAVEINVINGDLYKPYLWWIIFNAIFVTVGATLVTYVEPVAGGSGIPQVKCYLNGIKIPRIVRIKTLVVKAIGVITSVLGGLAGGKEGPMIHSGAVIAAGLSQGKSTTFQRDFNVLRYFRDDHEKRDFVVGGAAAGVSAAFGAPIGGVLFSLEEAASFWNQNLIWLTVFASIFSSFTLNIVLSAYHGLKDFHYPGLFNLGEFESLPFSYYELPLFAAMGVIGGLLGALWNSVNTNLTILRREYIKQKWAKVLEAVLISILTATFACGMTYSINDCRSLGQDPTQFPVQLFCGDSEYNAAAALWFQTPEASVKSLFHDPPGSHRIMTLFVFLVIYYPLSCVTFGMNVSMGIFIPTLLVGATWGRITAMIGLSLFPKATFFHPGKYALIGAAAQLGGALRMTISLTVILIETTGNLQFALPLIITLTIAKWVGDYFNEGIYDTLIVLANVPMLPWSLPNKYNLMSASEIMSHPVVCIRLKENVSYIYEILTKYPHNGFPVVDDVGENRDGGRLRGLMLRSQLVIILKNAWFDEKYNLWKDDATIEKFRNEYPRYPSIKSLKLNTDKLNYTINSEMFMNPSPKCVLGTDSVQRVFQNFRALGLRHMLVVDLENRVEGIITRKDFIRRH